MRPDFVRHRVMVVVLCTAVAAGAPAAPAEEPSPEQLRRELEAMKRQLQQLAGADQEAGDGDREAERRAQAAACARRAPAKAEAATTDEERLKREVTENVMRRVQPTLAAANKTFPSQFNPAIGLIVDTVGSYTENAAAATSRCARREIGLSASVDPFARGYAIFNGNAGRVRGGGGGDRDHLAAVQPDAEGRPLLRRLRPPLEVPRPRPAVREPADGARRVRRRRVAGRRRRRLSCLAPLEQYLTLTAGMYNKIGAENERVEQRRAARPLGVHLPRPRPRRSSASPTRTASTSALTLRRTRRRSRSTSAADGIERRDLTYRCDPLGRRRTMASSGVPRSCSTRRATAASIVGQPSVLRELARARRRSDDASRRPPTADDAAGLPARERGRPLQLRRGPPHAALLSRASSSSGRRRSTRAVGDTLAYSPYLTHLGVRVPAHPPAVHATSTRRAITRTSSSCNGRSIIGSHVHGFRDR